MQRGCQGEDTESRGCSVQECGCRTSDRRDRKDVNKLTSTESRSLVAAMEAAISSGEHLKVGDFHGLPMAICGTASRPLSCCPHGGRETFLPWHRLLMVQMEEVLALGQALPYWDWTKDDKVPQLWEGIRAPIRGRSGGRGCPDGDDTAVRRNDTIDVVFDVAELQTRTRTAFLRTKFDEFSTQIGAPHNLLHIWMNCDMLYPRTAGYDTVFYLHHGPTVRLLAGTTEAEGPRLSQARRAFGGPQALQ